MFAFLHFLFGLILLAVVIVLAVAFIIYRRLHGIARNFQQQMGGFGSREQAGYSGGNTSRHTSRTQANGCNEVITDERSPEEANRKIFSKDEGEYVDFKEK